MKAAAGNDIGALLSSVSVMLAAYGVFYTTQRERIDKAIENTNVPANQTELRSVSGEAARCANVAAVLAVGALIVWLLLLSEIVGKVGDALDAGLSPREYSTPDTIFFVAANAWLLLGLYIGSRWWKLRARRRSLAKHLLRSGPAPG